MEEILNYLYTVDLTEKEIKEVIEAAVEDKQFLKQSIDTTNTIFEAAAKFLDTHTEIGSHLHSMIFSKYVDTVYNLNGMCV